MFVPCRCGGMVDTADLKSSGGNSVPVRVRPPAPYQDCNFDKDCNPFNYFVL